MSLLEALNLETLLDRQGEDIQQSKTGWRLFAGLSERQSGAFIGINHGCGRRAFGVMKTVKAILFCAAICFSVLGQGTTVAPIGLDNREGDSTVIPFLGGIPARTQVIYGSANFSLFPPEGVYLTEIRFRMDGQYAQPFTGTTDLEVKLSTSGANPNLLNSTFSRNVGLDETVALPRQTVSLASGSVVPGGPNSFSVVVPLPNRFYYNPQNGGLLVDVLVYGGSGLLNLDWESNPTDSVSAATGGLTASVAGVVSSTAPVTRFVFTPIPEPSPLLTFALGIAAVIYSIRAPSPVRLWQFDHGCGRRAFGALNVMKTVKAILFCAVICFSALGQGTIVAPIGLDNREGDSTVIPFLGGIPARTQVIYGAGNFGLFPPEGVYLTEIRFRMDGEYLQPFTGTANLEVRLSTSTVNPNFLNSTFASNIGSDETIALPRQTVSLTSGTAVPGGPNSFSVIIPLPNRFYYNPRNGGLLLDVSVYSAAGLKNFDWDSDLNDSVSASTGALTASTAAIISSTAPVTQFVFTPIPEPTSLLTFTFGIAALIYVKGKSHVAS